MSHHPFYVGGPLLAGTPVYVERQADEQAFFHLSRMEYITLIETRQQGKTSLINHLMGRLSPQNYLFAYASMESVAARQIDEAAWYAHLVVGLLRPIKFIPDQVKASLPRNGAEWFNFLGQLAELTAQTNQNLVIALDEIGGTPSDWATDFFAAIRSTFNYRQIQPAFQRLTFILAGAYNPRTLIKNANISPFNIAHQVHLEDFSLEQTHQLTAHLIETPELQTLAAERIHYWTDGQPYLTHYLCQSLVAQPLTVVNIDTLVERLCREDTNHLPYVFAFSQNKKLMAYVKQVAGGANLSFAPAQSSQQMKLVLMGIIKSDAQGQCKIRNRLYEYLLSRHLADVSVDPVGPSDELYRTHLQELIHIHTRRLLILKEQQAYIGVPADPKILMEIQDIEKTLERLKAELQEIESGLRD